MPEKEPMTPSEATDKLISQFGHPAGDVAELIADGQPVVDVVAAITAAVATTFTTELSSTAAEAEYLANWSRSLRADCSLMYGQLRESQPELSREEINSNPDLQVLNGIRRGVHRAMVKAYDVSRRHRRYWEALSSG